LGHTTKTKRGIFVQDKYAILGFFKTYDFTQYLNGRPLLESNYLQQQWHLSFFALGEFLVPFVPPGGLSVMRITL